MSQGVSKKVSCDTAISMWATELGETEHSWILEPSLESH